MNSGFVMAVLGFWTKVKFITQWKDLSGDWYE